jgi:hypothetical protein
MRGFLRLRNALGTGALMLSIGACQTPAPTVPAAVVAAPQTKADTWQSIATEADVGRIQRLASAWIEGLGAARKANFKTALEEEGALLVPGASKARPAPTPGSYKCRLVTLGSTGKGEKAFERYNPFFCYVEVEGDLFTIVKQTGSQRPAGRLWEDDDPTRLVFLGTLALGNEEEVRAYGDDTKRDMAGVFQRIAPFRWRLVIPYPQDGAKLDVFELTPVADQPK